MKRRNRTARRSPVRYRRSRVFLLPTPRGLREITVSGSRQATQIGRYWNAVKLYIDVGDASALDEFRDEQITTARGGRVTLLTNLRELDRLGNAGELSFETIYADVA